MNRVIIATCMLAASSVFAVAQTDGAGWLNSETLQTRYGSFEFKNGYPVGDVTARLLDMQKLNRAIEVYTTQMMRVSEIAVREGMRTFGSRTPQQVVIWETLMDAKTVLLTAVSRNKPFGGGIKEQPQPRGSAGAACKWGVVSRLVNSRRSTTSETTGRS